MEERRGSEPDKVARAAGRGREDSAPALLQLGVLATVALVVVVIMAVSLILWAILR